MGCANGGNHCIGSDSGWIRDIVDSVDDGKGGMEDVASDVIRGNHFGMCLY